MNKPRRLLRAGALLGKNSLKLIIYKVVLFPVYKWYARKPVDEKLILFADYLDRPTPGNFLGLIDLCEKNGFRCVVMSGRPFGDKVPKWRKLKEIVKFLFHFTKTFARCKVLFLCEIFDLLDIVKPRTGTSVVQLWHGCGAMKMWGNSIIEKSWDGSIRKSYPKDLYTLICVSTEKAVAPFEDAFCAEPGVVQALGCPRTDIYFDKEAKTAIAKKVYSMFPEVGGRKIILYAPTFRGNTITQKAYIELELEFEQMMSELSEQYVLFVKLHPLAAKSCGVSEEALQSCTGSVFDVSEILSAEEALCAADILITDYSSIIFEYMLLERPIISYIYDIDAVMK